MTVPTTTYYDIACPGLNHIDLMMDTFIANASPEDLRAIVRGTLAAGTSGVSTTLTATARARLLQTKAVVPPAPEELFTIRLEDGIKIPTPELAKVLSRIRTLYGAGLGFASLRLLAVVVRGSRGVLWDDGSHLEELLASVDTDISQAIQSSREELDGGRVGDLAKARGAVDELRGAVEECRLTAESAESGNYGYSFEQGRAALEFWKI